MVQTCVLTWIGTVLIGQLDVHVFTQIVIGSTGLRPLHQITPHRIANANNDPCQYLRAITRHLEVWLREIKLSPSDHMVR